jgi:serine/threonine-protein kinase
LVHRDLKPENILIRPNGDVVVIDLGIVREAGTAGITATEAIHGPLSWPYCSPEQARNDKRAISFKSDFFSLGVIAYQLIAGFNPFNVSGQEHPARQREAILNLTPKPLVEVSGCHEPTSTLVMKMLEKQPYQRPRTPEILIEELHGALQ